MNKLNTKKGFTIIEVVLVLAIAGLIFLMVFIALPALQRNQRDTQRKNDLSRVQSAINSFQANNRGNVPTLAQAQSTLLTSYLRTGGDQFQDPAGTNYTFVGGTVGTLPAAFGATGHTVGAISYFTNARCNGENTTAGGGANKVAVSIALEGGGVYCLNN